MIDKQPLEGESVDDYIKRVRLRTGSTNKKKQTCCVRSCYKISSLRKEIDFEIYNNAVLSFCLKIKEKLLKGMIARVPLFGTLEQFECENAIVAKKKKGKTIVKDYRNVDFVKALENKYAKSLGNEEGESFRISKGSKAIKIVLKNPCKLKSRYSVFLEFEPTKYLVREIKNNLYGTEYVIIKSLKEEKLKDVEFKKVISKNIVYDFFRISFNEFRNNHDKEFILTIPFIGKIIYKPRKVKWKE